MSSSSKPSAAVGREMTAREEEEGIGPIESTGERRGKMRAKKTLESIYPEDGHRFYCRFDQIN
jgi:hypothetical protein